MVPMEAATPIPSPPTSLGTVVKVINDLTGDVLDITDYNWWRHIRPTGGSDLIEPHSYWPAPKRSMLKQTDIQKARRHLRAADPVMKTVIDTVGPFTLRLERDRFAMLVRSIISQQISTSAARSIRRRLQELAGPDGLKAANLAQFTVDQLRSVGLVAAEGIVCCRLGTQGERRDG